MTALNSPANIAIEPTPRRVRVMRASVLTILLAVLAIVFVAGVFWCQGITSLPSVNRQSEEVAALETHVLPLVKDLRATWYLNERFGSRSIYWKRGRFTKDPARARQDGEEVFDKEAEFLPTGCVRPRSRMTEPCALLLSSDAAGV